MIAAIFRGVYTASVDFTNLTGTMPTSVFLSILEPLLSVICISLPTLRPLWGRYRGDPASGAGTMELSDRHSHSQGSRGIRVTKDTSVNYRSKDREASHHQYDESGSERNLTVATGTQHTWSR